MRKFLLALGLLSLSLTAHADEMDDTTRELQKMQQEAQALLGQLQQTTAGIDQTPLLKAREKVMRLASDERFLKAAGSLWDHPARNTLLVVQAIFFLVMFFVKAWRQSKASNWFTRVLVGMVLSLFTWIVIVLALPTIILGEPFRIFVSTLWRVITH